MPIYQVFCRPAGTPVVYGCRFPAVPTGLHSYAPPGQEMMT